MASMAEVAAHLDLSEESIRKLKRQNVLPSPPRGQMDLDECRTAYIRHLRERAAGRASDGAEAEGLDLVAERARLASEQADHYAMRNKTARGESASVPAISSAMIGFVELSKTHLARIPARVARADIKLRDRIADAIEEALEELSNASVEEIIGSGADADDTDDED